jgi:hypothetical protein
MRDLLVTWLGHLANMRGLLSSPNKTRWIVENMDSVLVTIFTGAFVVLVVIGLTHPWGWMDDSPLAPAGRMRFLP